MEARDTGIGNVRPNEGWGGGEGGTSSRSKVGIAVRVVAALVAVEPALALAVGRFFLGRRRFAVAARGAGGAARLRAAFRRRRGRVLVVVAGWRQRRRAGGGLRHWHAHQGRHGRHFGRSRRLADLVGPHGHGQPLFGLLVAFLGRIDLQHQQFELEVLFNQRPLAGVVQRVSQHAFLGCARNTHKKNNPTKFSKVFLLHGE